MLAICVVSRRNTCTSISRGDKTLKDGFQRIANNGTIKGPRQKEGPQRKVQGVSLPCSNCSTYRLESSLTHKHALKVTSLDFTSPTQNTTILFSRPVP